MAIGCDILSKHNKTFSKKKLKSNAQMGISASASSVPPSDNYGLDLAKAIPAPIVPLHTSFLTLPNANTSPFESKGSLLVKPNVEGTRFESKTYSYLYYNSPWVSTVIDLISAACSKKFHIARRDGQPVDPKDEQVILSFLDAPNEFDTFLSFFRKTIKSLLIYGSAIIELHVSPFDKQSFTDSVIKALPPNLNSGYGDFASQIIEDSMVEIPQLGFPVFAAVLPFDQMVVNTNDAGTITGYSQFTVQGKTVDYAKTEVIQILAPDAENLVYGNSKLDGLFEILQIDALKDRRQCKVIKNESLVNKYVTMPAGTSEAELQKAQRVFDMYYQAHNSTSDIFTMTDDMKISVITEGEKEGSYLQLSLQIRDRVAAKYGLPVAIIDSQGTSSSHSIGVDSQQRQYLEIACRPWAQHAITMLNRKLMPHFGNVLGTDYVIVIDLEDDNDLADCEITWDKTVRNGTRTINEVRSIRGQQPVEGGDVPIIMTATGGMTLDQIQNPPEPPPPVFHAPLPPEEKPSLPNPDVTKSILIEDARRALRELRKSM